MKVVVTGKVAGESRQTAEQKLREAGHEVQPAVGADTDMLLTGERVGATKTNKAEALGVTVMPWEAFWQSPIEAAGLTIQEAAAAQEYVEEHGEPLVVRQIGPMLAKAEPLPVGDDWLYEVKFDGWRCVATVRDGRVSMQSRSGKTELSTSYPQIAEALSHFPDCVIDGELVSVDEDGKEIGLMNGRPTVYVVWDVLEVMGDDLRGRTLTERRRVLEHDLKGVFLQREANGLVQVSPTFDDGQALLDWAAAKGREGIVAKRRSSRYVEGHRGWVKVKCRNEQEFVIVGWTPGKGSNAGRVGGVLLAYWQDGELVYAGRCGTKYEADGVLATMTERTTSPLGEKVDVPKETTWVEPELVVQVLFQRWTEDGRLWHPIWKELRTDKAASEVTRDA